MYSDLPSAQAQLLKKFNNSRVHRALEALEASQKALEESLAGLYLNRQEKFIAFFLDVTDTWFFGEGPEFAERGKTKDFYFGGGQLGGHGDLVISGTYQNF